MIPIWFCVVSTENLTSSGIYAYRIIKAIKTTFDQADALYKEHQEFVYSTPHKQIMMFWREPDESPLVETA